MNETLRKRVGITCTVAPLPLIDAAGMTPVRLLPLHSCPDQAGHLLHDNLCPHVKRILDGVMARRSEELVGVVLVNCCDAMRRLADAWPLQAPDQRVFLVDLPMTGDARAIAFLGDEFNAITWDPIDPENPFASMAQRAISLPLNGPIQKRIAHLQTMAQRHDVRGAINPCHWGCRQGSGARGLITQGLRDIGVPVLALEVDCVDTRNFSQGQIETRLSAFLEMLADGV